MKTKNMPGREPHGAGPGRPGLSSNQLKLIAAGTMLVDHAGFLLFPGVQLLRIIGRLAFPIYAFMIAEGCRYTKHKLRYFLTMFLMALICQTVYFLYDGSTNMCILVTFSLSILAIYALQGFRAAMGSCDGAWKKVVSGAALLGLIGGVYALNQHLTIDYGFWGAMTPVLASLFQFSETEGKQRFQWLDCHGVHVLMLGVGLCLGAVNAVLGPIQWFSLAAIPLLLCYSGRYGKYRWKYFFYLFYPAHLLLLQGIALLLR